MKFRGKNLLPGVGLVALLIAAQLGAAAHAFEHDLEAAQAKVCGTCVVASQLGGACHAEPGDIDLPKQQFAFTRPASHDFRPQPRHPYQQRGPPRIHA